MMTVKKILSLFLIIFSFTIYSQNNGAGNTGLSFLKVGVTSRSISLGEAVVSMSEDASATFYNPAGLFLGKKNSILFMHNAGIIGTRSEFLAAKFNLSSRIALGLSLNNMSVSDIEVREIPGQPLDRFNSQNFALGFSGAYKVNEKIQLGVTAKFIYEKIFIDNADGYAFDFGGLFQDGKISFGVALSNVGSMNRLRNESTKLPSSMRFGGGYKISLDKINGSLQLGANGFKVLDGGKFHLNAGAEFLFKEFLAVRAGYQSGFENKSLTTGLGLKFKVFNLDYAFVPYKLSLGSSHTFTIGASF